MYQKWLRAFVCLLCWPMAREEGRGVSNLDMLEERKWGRKEGREGKKLFGAAFSI